MTRSRPSVKVARIKQDLRKDTPAALETEVRHSRHDHGKHHHGPPQIFLAIVAKHRELTKRKEEHRQERRRAKFAQLSGSADGVDEHDAEGEADGAETPATHSSGSSLYGSDTADALDVIDPQVSTVAALSDMTRAIVVPASLARSPPVVELAVDDEASSTEEDSEGKPRRHRRRHHHSALDRYVASKVAQRKRHLAKAKGVLKGVWTFIKTPLGIIVAIYGFLVVFSGAGLVICLAGWVPGDKAKQVEVFSQATNALFTITGVGFIPWRCRDTYLISRICHYRNLSNKLRRQRGLEPLTDVNDLAFEAGMVEHPATQRQHLAEEKIALEVEREDAHVLSPRQAAQLRSCQRRFGESCTWYRATETPTHLAFPIGTAVTVTAMNVGNSLFQCLMCGFMWGYATHYKDVSEKYGGDERIHPDLFGFFRRALPRPAAACMGHRHIHAPLLCLRYRLCRFHLHWRQANQKDGRGHGQNRASLQRRRCAAGSEHKRRRCECRCEYRRACRGACSNPYVTNEVLTTHPVNTIARYLRGCRYPPEQFMHSVYVLCRRSNARTSLSKQLASRHRKATRHDGGRCD